MQHVKALLTAITQDNALAATNGSPNAVWATRNSP